MDLWVDSWITLAPQLPTMRFYPPFHTIKTITGGYPPRHHVGRGEAPPKAFGRAGRATAPRSFAEIGAGLGWRLGGRGFFRNRFFVGDSIQKLGLKTGFQPTKNGVSPTDIGDWIDKTGDPHMICCSYPVSPLVRSQDEKDPDDGTGAGRSICSRYGPNMGYSETHKMCHS
jgi:hypothetical protein